MLKSVRNIDRKTNVTEWQKGPIGSGRARGHKVNEVGQLVGVSKRTVHRVYSGVEYSQLKIGDVTMTGKRYSPTGTAAILHG